MRKFYKQPPWELPRRQNRYYKKVMRELHFHPRGLSKREKVLFGSTFATTPRPRYN